MNINKVREAKTADEARQYAIDWQNELVDEDTSYGELAEWSVVWIELAEKFNLTEELKDNGII